jgi:glycosyltransferase involved in cell wall biosynthesis
MKIILFANTDWNLFNYRLTLARNLKAKGHDLLLLSPDGNYSKKIKTCGFDWQLFNVSRSGINPIKETFTILHLAQYYRHEKPDLVHHFTSKCVIYGSLAARLAGVNRIVNSVTGMGYVFIQNNFINSAIRPLIILLYKIALKNSTVLFQNQHDMDFFTSHHLVNTNQSKLIPGSGVDTRKFKPTLPPVGNLLVVLPARMIWDKGIREFVEAAKIIKGKGIKARFALVGAPDKGNPSSITESQLKKWEKSGYIEYWGWEEDMAAVYQKSSIVCLPSYREGLAKSLIEAAASGRSLVASDIPGCQEVVKEGINGFLVPPKQVLPLAEALENILLDTKLRKKMGVESRKIATSCFSAQKINAETITEYNKLFNVSQVRKLDS